MLEKLLNLLADRLMPLRDRLDRLRWPRSGVLAEQLAQSRTNILSGVQLPKLAHAATWARSKKGLQVLVSATALAVAATVLIIHFWPAPAAPKYAWYMDLATGELFVAQYGLVPPIAAPSGKLTDQGQTMGVRAHVFSRSSCWWPWSRYVGYLETTATQAKTGMNRTFFFSPQSDLRVSSPNHPGDWVDMNSPAGSAIVGAAIQADGSGRASHECYP